MTKKQGNPIDTHVGRRVRLRRMLIGMSQEKLGELLGLTFQQVQKYEKGVNRIGSGRLHQIGQILGVPVQYFFDDMPGGIPDGGMGMAESATAPAFEMGDVTSPEGIQLNRYFYRIRDARVRRRIIDLVRALAGEEDDASSVMADS
ncbi:MAG: helix-turn-helix domain-containing protein [Alphaproteobacteria bacterium]|nr:helix-turn-helix domain-containing protein [Alphaproteobacteria bacterium]